MSNARQQGRFGGTEDRRRWRRHGRLSIPCALAAVALLTACSATPGPSSSQLTVTRAAAVPWAPVSSGFGAFGAAGLGPTPAAFAPTGEWAQAESLESAFRLSNGAEVTLGHGYSGERRYDDGRFGAAFVGLWEDWEEDRLNETSLTIGLWGDRVELTSLHSFSQHGEAAQGVDVAAGQGFFQGLDAELLRGEIFDLSLSGAYGVADEDFGLAEGDDDSLSDILDSATEIMDLGLEAEFALGFADLSLTHDRAWETEDNSEDYEREVSSDYEAELAFDDLALTLSYSESTETEGRGVEQESETEVEYEAEAEIELDLLRDLLGNPFGSAFWAYAPTSVSLGYELERTRESDGGREQSTEVGFDMTWDWDGGHLSLEYAYEFEDEREAGSAGEDTRSDEVEIGGGLDGRRWSLDLDLEVNREAGLNQWNDSSELEIEPRFDFTFRPVHLPDLSLSGSTDYQRGNYVSDNGESVSGSWELLTELDFAKYWPDVLNGEEEAFLMVLQLEGESWREDWDDEASGGSTFDYFVGFKVDLTLGE